MCLVIGKEADVHQVWSPEATNASVESEFRRNERFHRDGGIGEGALGLGCCSRTPQGVPRTEPSCPCCLAAAPELIMSVADRAFNLQEGARFSLDPRPTEGPGVSSCRSRAHHECRGRGTPVRFAGARAAKPMTSRQVECGLIHSVKNRKEEFESHGRWSTRNTNTRAPRC